MSFFKKNKKINVYKIAYNTGKGYWSESKGFYRSEAHFVRTHNFDEVETRILTYTRLEVDVTPSNKITSPKCPRPHWTEEYY